VSLALLFLAGLVLSVALYAAMTVALRVHRHAGARGPLPGFTPPVSIIKPLCGLDDELEKNLDSFYRLDYPCYEVVFSLARRGDPALSVAARVAGRHPEVPTSVVVDGREPGKNAKVNRLAAGVARARFDHFLFSDGNVRVEPGFLRSAVAPMANPRVGLVSSLFRAVGARSLGSRLESLYLNGVLLPATAAVVQMAGTPCVVGKSILLSRLAWASIGGLEPLRDFLAEDFLLGRLVHRAGYEVVLSSDEIETTEIRRTPAAAWERHRRWGMLRRRLGGPAYLLEIFASPAFWFAGTAIFAGRSPSLVLLAAVLWAARLSLEVLSGFAAGRPLAFSDGALLPLRDIVVAANFWAGLFGRTTRWRGRRLRVGRLTRLLPVGSASGPATRAGLTPGLPSSWGQR
jgi:ceramide glucosyltransferase